MKKKNALLGWFFFFLFIGTCAGFAVPGDTVKVALSGETEYTIIKSADSVAVKGKPYVFKVTLRKNLIPKGVKVSFINKNKVYSDMDGRRYNLINCKDCGSSDSIALLSFSSKKITSLKANDYEVEYTYEFIQTQGDSVIHVEVNVFDVVEGVSKPVSLNGSEFGNLSVDNQDVWSANGLLYIRTTPGIKTVSVYTITGQLAKQIAVTGGEISTPMPKGLYIVRLDNMTRKVIIK